MGDRLVDYSSERGGGDSREHKVRLIYGQQYLLAVRVHDGLRHRCGDLSHHGIGKHNTDRPKYCLRYTYRHSNRVFSACATIGSSFEHLFCGAGIRSEREKLNLFTKSLMDFGAELGSYASAEPIYYDYYWFFSHAENSRIKSVLVQVETGISISESHVVFNLRFAS